jgi:hypothetical protein
MPDEGEGSWWKNKFVIGPLVAGVTVIFVAVATPVGERVREALFPTSIVVEGSVLKSGKPAAQLRILLDDSTTTTTTDSGKFLFENVSKGVHAIQVRARGEQILFNDRFSVPEGLKDKLKLDPFNLEAEPQGKIPEDPKRPAPNLAFVKQSKQPDYQVSLMHAATPLPPGGRPAGFESNTYRITVWVQATSAISSQIERVTYYLHPTFNPSVVTRYSPENQFSLSFTVWGQFELKAKVYFKDGQVKDVSRHLSF